MLQILSQSLGPWSFAASAMAEVVRRQGIGLDALEASASCRGGDIEGGRMMIECGDAKTALALLALLPAPAEMARELVAHAHGAPLIVGWDTSRPTPVAKIYLNLSDSSQKLRVRVAKSAGLPGAPHVIGLNLSDRGAERKVYDQLEQWPAGAPAALRSWARDLPLAGLVQSFDLDDSATLSPRAVFVAPRQGSVLTQRLTALPGWDGAQVDMAIPFAWGQVRSVGFSQDGQRWVVYAKPRDRAPELGRLEPDVCVRCGDVELGIFVVCDELAQRAYVRTARHAVSYRVREGDPSRDMIEQAMTWAYDVVTSRERDGAHGALRWVDPPPGMTPLLSARG